MEVGSKPVAILVSTNPAGRVAPKENRSGRHNRAIARAIDTLVKFSFIGCKERIGLKNIMMLAIPRSR
jgi:hypothetical protein